MIGKTLDNKYRIIAELGEGGMGTVYLAEHTRGIGKKFAIKSFSSTLGLDSHFRERFYREATNQALLDHPNIVHTDFFEKDGQFFLVMEYVDGQDLSKLIKARGQLKEKDALSILRDVLRGLEFAHTKGIIHGGIKPSNILIGKSGIAQITDFGIASLVWGGLTSTGATVGSPWYMSPEQIQHPEQLDPRTDIYSLGIVLYEMLTGHLPFEGETDFSVLDQQIHATPPNLRLKNPEVSEKLAEIVLKAMAKNPAERFQDCTEFLQCLPEQQRQWSEGEARRKTEERGRKLTTSDHVFVCYAREDEAFVLQLAENLKGRGVPVWLDQWDIPPGADWDRTIDNAIYDCAKFIIILSSQAVESREVRGELRIALDKHKPIIPVIHSACQIPRQLLIIQYVDFTSRGPNDEAALRQLLRTLATSTTDSTVAQHVEATDSQRSIPERAAEKRESRLESGTVFRDRLKDGSQGPEMVVIPAGTFQMGDIQGDGNESERPVHTVHITRPFAIGRYEVTFEEYDGFAAAAGRKLPVDNGWGRGQRPVINVSWNDAVEYAKWLSIQTGKRYRLPIEAEWEYAARSGGQEERWTGTSREQELSEYAWYYANSGSKTQPVGGKKPNGLGLYDMGGNVSEWVEDCWHNNYAGAPTDGSAWGQENDGNFGHRVLRGGSCGDVPQTLRVSFREGYDVADCLISIGFRLARDLD
jgi:formylglycine-generating enzyme required for sulfatase activity/serine/threonine protein kinase